MGAVLKGLTLLWESSLSLRWVLIPTRTGPYRPTLATDPHVSTDKPYNPEPIMIRTVAAACFIGATCTASLPLAAGLLVAGLFCATIDRNHTPA